MPGGLSNILIYILDAKKTLLLYTNSCSDLKFGLNGFIPTLYHFYPNLHFLINFIKPLTLFSLFFSLIGIFYIEKYWKKLLLLTILAIVLPNPSFIYTCINLFFPIILFLNEKEHPMSDWIYLILMIIILSPFQYESLNGLPLKIIYDNIAVLIIQLLLSIEGVNYCIICLRNQTEKIITRVQ